MDVASVFSIGEISISCDSDELSVVPVVHQHSIGFTLHNVAFEIVEEAWPQEGRDTASGRDPVREYIIQNHVIQRHGVFQLRVAQTVPGRCNVRQRVLHEGLPMTMLDAVEQLIDDTLDGCLQLQDVDIMVALPEKHFFEDQLSIQGQAAVVKRSLHFDHLLCGEFAVRMLQPIPDDLHAHGLTEGLDLDVVVPVGVHHGQCGKEVVVDGQGGHDEFDVGRQDAGQPHQVMGVVGGGQLVQGVQHDDQGTVCCGSLKGYQNICVTV